LLDAPARLPNGLIYRPDFLTLDEEEILLAYLQNLPLEHSTFRPRSKDGHRQQEEYTAKRRHILFGWGWDYERQRLIPGEPLPRFLQGIQKKIAKWLNIPAARVAEALVNEYPPTAGMGWHTDGEGFEHIIGVSVGGWSTIRFRPARRKREMGKPLKRNAADVVPIELEPRSAYIMQGPVRWDWQHSVAPVKTLRYSITFRTLPENRM